MLLFLVYFLVLLLAKHLPSCYLPICWKWKFPVKIILTSSSFSFYVKYYYILCNTSTTLFCTRGLYTVITIVFSGAHSAIKRSQVPLEKNSNWLNNCISTGQQHPIVDSHLLGCTLSLWLLCVYCNYESTLQLLHCSVGLRISLFW